MDIAVAVGSTADLDAVEPLWRAMQAHHGELTGGDFPMREPDHSWQLRRAEYLRWLDSGTARLLLARASGSADVLGYALIRWHPAGPTWDFGDELGELESLAVAPGARGQGVGGALIEAGRDELAARGIDYWSVAVVETNPAVELYERAGFRRNYRMMFGRIEP